MNHDVTIEGRAFRLRPVRIDDVTFITQLRSDPELTHFLYPRSTTVPEQIQWLQRYFEHHGDYYFIIERRETGQAEGTVAIYDLDTTLNCAQWGRWFIRPGSVGAVESAFLMYRIAFEVLGLSMLYCRTVPQNKQVMIFHKLLGLETYAELPNYWDFGEVSFDVIELRITREAWEKCRPSLEAKANMIAKMCHLGE